MTNVVSSTKKAVECSPGASTVCAAMKYALDNGGARQLGIFVATTMNLSTGEISPAFAYRMPVGGHTLTLRVCPWCGSHINSNTP